MATTTNKTLNESKGDKDNIIKSLQQAHDKMKEAKKVKVSIPANLQKFIGPTLFLSINGVNIVLPVDGTKHEVPEPYKALIDEYISNIQM